MEFVRRVLAEWPLFPARLVHTRLGMWLSVLLAGLWWLQGGAPAADPVGIAVLAGTLGAVVCAGALAGSRADRAALAHRLLHPTTPVAIAAGRWVGSAAGAACLVLVVTGRAAWTTHAPIVNAGATLAGLTAAAAVSACVLALALLGGVGLALLAFLWLLLVSAVPPEAILGLGHRGVIPLIGAAFLELCPSVWRYRGIATGNPGAIVHAVVWVGVGLGIATWQITRLGRRRL